MTIFTVQESAISVTETDDEGNVVDVCLQIVSPSPQDLGSPITIQVRGEKREEMI